MTENSRPRIEGETPTAEDSDQAITIERLSMSDRVETIDVIAQGMRDNPLHIAAYGSNSHQRLRTHRQLLGGALDIMDAMDVWVLKTSDQVLGAAGMVGPGRCQPTLLQRLRLLSLVAGLGLPAAPRVVRWLSKWSQQDLPERHVHVGPVAVHPAMQGRGLGTRLLAKVCSELDAAAVTGYLETDKADNLPFYERSGFEVVGSAEVIGVQNWFMRRPSSPTDQQTSGSVRGRVDDPAAGRPRPIH